MMFAVSLSARARLQYPSPAHTFKSFLSEAFARDWRSWNALRNSSYFRMTLVTWVCWSITSETKILYGSLVFLQGRSLLFFLYQERIFFRNWGIVICQIIP